MRDNTFVLKRFTDFLLNSLYLAVAVATANNKIIGKGAYLSGIQHNDTIGLFVWSSFYYSTGYFYCFQNSLSLPIYLICIYYIIFTCVPIGVLVRTTDDLWCEGSNACALFGIKIMQTASGSFELRLKTQGNQCRRDSRPRFIYQPIIMKKATDNEI